MTMASEVDAQTFGSASPHCEALDALARRARREMECLAYPAREWVPPRRCGHDIVSDVVIVGGGQNGLAVALRLRREGVTNVRIFEKSARGQEGPWVSYARMRTLRTPKTVSGPELGIPSLSVQAWYEARFGVERWNALSKIPREHWQAYLVWLRQAAAIDVTNGADVKGIEPLEGGLLAVFAVIDGRAERVLARNVVLATGIEGSGRWLVPRAISAALPSTRYAHTAASIDFQALAGKRVAVIGAGASAFDNAATALEAGAATVDLYARRRSLPKSNPNRWIEFAGFLRHFGDLDDARKWEFMKTIFDMNQPPPQDTFERCAAHDRFTLHLGSPVQGVEEAGNAIRLALPGRSSAVDFLIVGTGLSIELGARPELSRFASEIALWSDRYQPPPGEENATMGGFPYLTVNFQFTEKVAGEAPYLKNIYNQTYGAMMSLAASAGISQLKFSTERIALGITRQLFLEDADAHLASLRAYDDPELDTSGYEASRRERARTIA